MMGTARKLKARYDQQRGRCYWCGGETFLHGSMSKSSAAKHFNIEVGSTNWKKMVRNREATLEHLLPSSKGGKNNWSNLAMACKGCNSSRGNDLQWLPPQRDPATQNAKD